MRHLFVLLALFGLAGIVFGALTTLHSAPGPTGPLPFSFEYAGGPGSIIAGLFLVATSLYLRSVWQGRD
jgi:hypothetical protein